MERLVLDTSVWIGIERGRLDIGEAVGRNKKLILPAIVAGEGSFHFPQTPVKNLLLCADSCFPGIGVPAVAGSGLLAANSISLASVQPQLKLLEKLKQ